MTFSSPVFDVSALLSNSSKITIPCLAFSKSLLHSNNSDSKTFFSIVPPTYPSCVNWFVSTIITGLFGKAFFNCLNVSVLPVPVGPIIIALFFLLLFEILSVLSITDSKASIVALDY